MLMDANFSAPCTTEWPDGSSLPVKLYLFKSDLPHNSNVVTNTMQDGIPVHGNIYIDSAEAIRDRLAGNIDRVPKVGRTPHVNRNPRSGCLLGRVQVGADRRKWRPPEVVQAEYNFIVRGERWSGYTVSIDRKSEGRRCVWTDFYG